MIDSSLPTAWGALGHLLLHKRCRGRERAFSYFSLSHTPLIYNKKATDEYHTLSLHKISIRFGTDSFMDNKECFKISGKNLSQNPGTKSMPGWQSWNGACGLEFSSAENLCHLLPSVISLSFPAFLYPFILLAVAVGKSNHLMSFLYGVFSTFRTHALLCLLLFIGGHL